MTTERLSVNMNADTAEALHGLTGKRDMSMTEAVRRAIAVLFYIETAHTLGNAVIIEDAKGDRRELILL